MLTDFFFLSGILNCLTTKIITHCDILLPEWSICALSWNMKFISAWEEILNCFGQSQMKQKLCKGTVLLLSGRCSQKPFAIWASPLPHQMLSCSYLLWAVLLRFSKREQARPPEKAWPRLYTVIIHVCLDIFFVNIKFQKKWFLWDEKWPFLLCHTWLLLHGFGEGRNLIHGKNATWHPHYRAISEHQHFLCCKYAGNHQTVSSN